jgi:hypothetical protein
MGRFVVIAGVLTVLGAIGSQGLAQFDRHFRRAEGLDHAYVVDDDFVLVVGMTGEVIWGCDVVSRASLGPPTTVVPLLTQPAADDVLRRIDSAKRVGDLVRRGELEVAFSQRRWHTDEHEHAMVRTHAVLDRVESIQVAFFRLTEAVITRRGLENTVLIGDEWYWVPSRDLARLVFGRKAPVMVAGPVRRPAG